jgi:aryl-alcohol dehydrogenase-like predicted oxidoreductase
MMFCCSFVCYLFHDFVNDCCAVVATKFMPSRMANGATLDGIRQQLSESLQRLNCEHVDLYYMHRVCSKVAIEDIARSMKQLQVPCFFAVLLPGCV